MESGGVQKEVDIEGEGTSRLMEKERGVSGCEKDGKGAGVRPCHTPLHELLEAERTQATWLCL